MQDLEFEIPLASDSYFAAKIQSTSAAGGFIGTFHTRVVVAMHNPELEIVYLDLVTDGHCPVYWYAAKIQGTLDAAEFVVTFRMIGTRHASEVRCPRFEHSTRSYVEVYLPASVERSAGTHPSPTIIQYLKSSIVVPVSPGGEQNAAPALYDSRWYLLQKKTHPLTSKRHLTCLTVPCHNSRIRHPRTSRHTTSIGSCPIQHHSQLPNQQPTIYSTADKLVIRGQRAAARKSKASSEKVRDTTHPEHREFYTGTSSASEALSTSNHPAYQRGESRPSDDTW